MAKNGEIHALFDKREKVKAESLETVLAKLCKVS